MSAIDRSAPVFTAAELDYLSTQPLARIATASATGVPYVAAVGFGVDGDTLVTGAERTAHHY